MDDSYVNKVGIVTIKRRVKGDFGFQKPLRSEQAAGRIAEQSALRTTTAVRPE